MMRGQAPKYIFLELPLRKTLKPTKFFFKPYRFFSRPGLTAVVWSKSLVISMQQWVQQTRYISTVTTVDIAPCSSITWPHSTSASGRQRSPGRRQDAFTRHTHAVNHPSTLSTAVILDQGRGNDFFLGVSYSSLHFLPFSLEVDPLNPTMGSGGRCMLSSGVWSAAQPKSNLVHLVFSARQHICYSALYAIARPSVRPSVCLSVRLSHGWISQRRLKIRSRNLHHRVAPWL